MGIIDSMVARCGYYAIDITGGPWGMAPTAADTQVPSKHMACAGIVHGEGIRAVRSTHNLVLSRRAYGLAQTQELQSPDHARITAETIRLQSHN